jgi:hypothetical protein
MSIRFADAQCHVVDCLRAWKREAEPPTGDGNFDFGFDYLRECLCVLLDHQGGMQWLEKNPRVLRDVDPVLHCASFRTADLREYRSVLSIEYKGQTLYLRPEDAEALTQFT